MKILIISEMSVPYAVGGGEVRYGLLARELVRRGHQVTWLSMRQRDCLDTEYIDGVLQIHRGPRIRHPPARSFTAMLRFMLTSFFHVLLHRYDVIDTQTYAPLPMVWLACWLSQQKMVATIHDVSRVQKDQWMSNRFSYLMAVAETVLYRLPYPRIIAVSHSTANALISRWRVSESRITVIPNGIELPTFSKRAEQARDIDLLFAGRFVPTKNIDDLLEIILLCHQAGAIRRVALIGEGPLLESMIQKSNALGLSEVVEFTGRKSNTEVLQLMQRTKVFFHASSREGFPVVMVEALACGIPVVAYNVPGVIDVIDQGKTGILVPERDVTSHAQACMELLRSEELRNDMGMTGHTLVCHSLTIAKITDAIVRVYYRK